jgi:uncharacterized protein (DUF305 family)
MKRCWTLGLATLAVALAASSGARAGDPAATAEAAYLAQNDAAMAKMMAGMTVKPTGDVDRDFVDMMVPHHQGAIDMAEAVLRYGHNEVIRRMAQEIIVTQQEEIAAMRRAVGEPLPASSPAPTQAQPSHDTAMPAGMEMR